jgi:PEP-CTERM motif
MAVAATPIPEPDSMLALVIGFIILAGFRRSFVLVPGR